MLTIAGWTLSNPLQIDNPNLLQPYLYVLYQATERYQQLGAREDAFAEPTDRFSEFHQAVSCMINNCGFEPPFDPQRKLFEEI